MLSTSIWLADNGHNNNNKPAVQSLTSYGARRNLNSVLRIAAGLVEGNFRGEPAEEHSREVAGCHTDAGQSGAHCTKDCIHRWEEGEEEMIDLQWGEHHRTVAVDHIDHVLRGRQQGGSCGGKTGHTIVVKVADLEEEEGNAGSVETGRVAIGRKESGCVVAIAAEAGHREPGCVVATAAEAEHW